jgi:hypothetical protein
MKIKEHNVTTGEIIEREMTAEEIAQREMDEMQSQQNAADQAAKKAAREAVLTKLGLTAEEVAALLS